MVFGLFLYGRNVTRDSVRPLTRVRNAVVLGTQLRERDDLWRDCVSAASDVEGLEMDLPEEDERVARVWKMTARRLDAAREILPAMRDNGSLHQAVNAALWIGAGGKIEASAALS